MVVKHKQLKIVFYPHPVLRVKAKPVEGITDEVRAVAQQMLRIMHEAPGVGLAAPQVGLSWRMFVANPSGEAGDDHVFINPVLSGSGRETSEREEGCLSLPGVNAVVRRPKVVTIEAMNLEGETFRMSSDDLPARVWQHEYDHLDGVLIIDRMSEIDRLANRKLLRELEEEFND